MCWATVLCSATRVVYKPPGTGVGHWKIQRRYGPKIDYVAPPRRGDPKLVYFLFIFYSVNNRFFRTFEGAVVEPFNYLEM